MLKPQINLLLLQFSQIDESKNNEKLLRQKVYSFPMVNEFSSTVNWDLLTVETKIILPVNKLYCNDIKDITNYNFDENGSLTPKKDAKLIDIGSKDFNLINDYSENNKPPIFMVGDVIIVQSGYVNPKTNSFENLDKEKGKHKEMYSKTFFITKLTWKEYTLEIELNGYEYLFKQIQAPKRVIDGFDNGKVKNDLSNYIKECINLTNNYLEELKKKTKGKKVKVYSNWFNNLKIKYNLSQLLEFNDQLIVTGNQTIAEFLQDLNKDYYLKSWFVGNYFHISITPINNKAFYNQTTRETTFEQEKENEKIEPVGTFSFQKNIISNDLEYLSKKNIKLSAIVSNTFFKKDGTFTKDGFEKNKKIKISVYLDYDDKGEERVIELYDNKGKKTGKVPPSTKDATKDGQRFMFTRRELKRVEDLTKYGFEQLRKYYYNGFRGSFETFGEPQVRITEIITLIDEKHPEMNGDYRVKKVETSFGMGGYRQNIELNLKIPKV